ncbi:MAG TPA: hypothetical protein PK082_11255 [Phycisphaerae bacterium]|nr:hypothetical protein [Phycisphaerae bacterium]
MIALSDFEILLIALGILYVASCVHMARYARRTGRNAWLWFFLTLLLTAVPVTLYFYVVYFLQRRRELSGPTGRLRRCPHCRRLISPGTPLGACPHCRMPLGDEVQDA